MIIITLFNVGAKHSYVTITYIEANLSQSKQAIRALLNTLLSLYPESYTYKASFPQPRGVDFFKSFKQNRNTASDI